MQGNESNFDSMWLTGGIIVGLFFGISHDKLISGLAFGLTTVFILSHVMTYKNYFFDDE